MRYTWNGIYNIESKSYICGYCSNSISSEHGFSAALYDDGNNHIGRVFIYICHFCGRPTFFDMFDAQAPSPKYGDEILDIEDEKIRKLYDEARKCIGSDAPTSAILTCRKLLMHIAVEKGAEENLKFIEYVRYLSDKGYIPPGSKGWVDEIREKGNEANHEIVIMSSENAKDLLRLTEMLLKIIYQFPAEVKRKRFGKTIPTT
jgi:hypothetical protein